MKVTKKILSLILVSVMLISMFSTGLSVNAVESPTGTIFKPLPTTPAERPAVQFYCTEVTYVAKAVNSVEPGTTIVKATPSGIPELSGTYAAQSYAGETPAATKITFVAKTIGITPTSLTCNNETIEFSDMIYNGATGEYTCEIISGTAVKYEDGTFEPLVFTMDYKWTDGNEYQEKCVSFVEDITTGGVFTYIECTFKPFSGTASFYRTSVSAITRLLGKGVYYEQPANITTSGSDPYKSYGVYNTATATELSRVESGYNTLLYKDDKNVEAKGGTKDIYFSNFLSGVPSVHIYVDSSTATTLSDINLRFDANTQALSDRNNSNPYTAVSNIYVYDGLQSNGLAGESNTTAENTIGYVVPAKANYGVRQQYENAAMNTITGGARAYSKIFTKGFNGTVANIADGSQYTVTHEYYSYNYVNHSLDEGNLTTIAQVATPMTFHIVDKSELRDLIEYVMTSDPDTPVVRNTKKGTNPQQWYYQSGFSSFQETYVRALNVANNTRAPQSEIDATTKALKTAYSNLTLKTADYTEVNALRTQANEIVKNAYAYKAEDVALVEEALTYYKPNYNILYQNAVDVMAENLRLAIKNAKPLPADYQEVYAAIIDFESLDEKLYTSDSWQNVLNEISLVDFGLSVLEQSTVNAYATLIRRAIDGLVLRTADFDELMATVEEAKGIKLSNYSNADIITSPLSAAEEAIEDNSINAWLLERQDEVDELNLELRTAIDSLVLKGIDKSALKEAIEADLYELEKYYDQTLLATYKTLVAEGQAIYDDESMTTILHQETVDNKTAEITAAYEALQASYNLPVDLTGLKNALIAADEIESQYYIEDDELNEFFAAKESGYEIYYSDLTSESQQLVNDAAERIHSSISGLTLKPADKTRLNSLKLELATMLSDELIITTYIDGVLGEKTVSKYNSSDIVALITSINALLKENLTILDNERIDAFADNIETQIAELETAKTDEYLQLAITEYENSSPELCTTKEWTEYTEKYNGAKSLTDDAGQDEINAALTDLVNARPLFSVDKSALIEILEVADKIDLTLYETDAAFIEFIAATTEGEQIIDTDLKDTDDNRKLVADSVARIKNAIDSLNLIIIEPEIPEAYFKAVEGTETVVDKERGIIYGLPDDGLNNLEGYVEYAGGEIEYESDNGSFGTGTVVNFIVNGEVFESYTVVIFGDVYSDGTIDSFDVSVVAAYINGDTEIDNSSPLYLAADVYADGVIDTFDLAVLMTYVNGDCEISQTPEF